MRESNVNNSAPFSKRHPRLNAFIGLIVLLSLVVGSCCIIYEIWIAFSKSVMWLVESVSKLDAVVIVALITGTVSIVSVLISSVVSKCIDYRRERKNYLAQKREKSYMAFVEMVYKIQKNGKEPGSYPTKEMLEDIYGFSQELTLWGSKRVASKWVDFRLNSANPEEAKKSIYKLEEIMNEMRADMGVKRMKKGKLLSFFINDIDKNK